MRGVPVCNFKNCMACVVNHVCFKSIYPSLFQWKVVRLLNLWLLHWELFSFTFLFFFFNSIWKHCDIFHSHLSPTCVSICSGCFLFSFHFSALMHKAGSPIWVKGCKTGKSWFYNQSFESCQLTSSREKKKVHGAWKRKHFRTHKFTLAVLDIYKRKHKLTYSLTALLFTSFSPIQHISCVVHCLN